MNNLPGVWKANLESVNSCTTTEGEEPVYPDPGPEVQYGDGMSSSSPPTQGNCNGAVSGKTYAQPSVDSPSPAASSSPAEYSDAASSSTASSAPTTAPASYSTNTSPAQVSAFPHRNGNGPESYSTMTVTIDCPSTVTSTLYPTMYTGDNSQATPSPPTYTSSGFVTSTVTGSIPPATPTTQPPPTSNSTNSAGPGPGYAATSDLSTYTPCVAGTFICTSSTTFYTCDRDSYTAPRQVADGMECLPNLSPSTSGPQQGNTPQGYYRNDRYVRSRPNGDCRDEGALQCTNGGQGFEVCDQGGWVDMGSVAAGTTCQDGEIVAS